MRLVVDTNVLVSALLSARGAPRWLLQAADAGLVRLVVSERLLDELHDVLSRERFRPWITVADADEFLDVLRESAEVVVDPVGVAPRTRDPDDDYLVALTAASDADALVTGDRDLLDAQLPGIRVMAPATVRERLEGTA